VNNGGVFVIKNDCCEEAMWWYDIIWWVGCTQIDAEAPFSAAFSGKSDGWGWVSRVIGVGASFGILTSLLVAMLGQARYMCVIGRSNVVPSWFARVHPRTSTPVNASAFLGIYLLLIFNYRINPFTYLSTSLSSSWLIVGCFPNIYPQPFRFMFHLPLGNVCYVCE